jgi:undecaprenyl-diphosphatase
MPGSSRHTIIALGQSLELRWLLFLAGLVCAVWALAELIDEVIEGSTSDIDRDILLALRTEGDLSDPIGPGWVEEMGRDLTALGGVAVLTLATASVALYFLMRHRTSSMLFLLSAVGGGIAISSIAKDVFDRPRPELVPYGSYVHTASFPSGHSMMAAVAYLSLGVLIARVQPSRRLKAFIILIAVMLTVLVGISRVYLGVHWPTDVLAGWLAGAAWAAICFAVAQYLGRRGNIETEG